MILYIDDNSDYRTLLQATFGRMTAPIQVAHSAEDGLELIKDQKFNLVIIDFYLPGMNGADCAKIIREDYPNAKIAIISAVKEIFLPKTVHEIKPELILLKPLCEDDYSNLMELVH